MTPEVTVQADAIPDELRARDQWLLWDASADAPRRPHWRGDFAVSWTDPDDWHSFEEAIDAVEETDSWGLGYVFANGIEHIGVYGALDLDGCVAEDGGPKDWLPSLQPFVDEGAYVEFSPSGGGMHVPIEAFEPPEWWSDAHFTADEHEGVEAYSKKFFTFTGDQLENTGQEVVEAAEWIEDWLAEAYEAITGEDPRDAHTPAEQTGLVTEPEKSREELAEMSTTGDYDDVLDAVRQLRPTDLRLRSSKSGTEKPGVESWDPGYRTSQSGESLKRFTDDGTWIDMRESDEGFDTLSLFAAEQGIIREPYDDLEGEDFHDAVDLARDQGAPIPVFDGERAALEDAVDDDVEVAALPREKLWETWSDARLDGEITQQDHIPEMALRHVAEEQRLYDFDALDEEPDDLPLKAHNRALWWVTNEWADEHNLDEATDRPYLRRTDTSRAVSWQDVRYIYDESAEEGRFAAVQLLRRRNHFLTPEDTEVLHVYDPERGIFDSDLRYDIGRTLDRELRSYYSQHEKNEILERLKEDTVKREELEAAGFTTNYVCVENGVLDVDARVLLGHDPKYQFTTYLPVEYDPEAGMERLDAFLDEITQREADKLTLVELVGNCLLPNYEYEKILVLFGEGSNGKSTWYDVVRTFLGSASSPGDPTNVDSLTLQQITENRFATSSLVGKWANIGEDLPEKKIQDLGPLKDLTGGGETSVEPKGKERFSFHNRAKMMFAANRPPVLPERSTAVKRRLVPVHLPYRFTTDPADGHKDAQKEGLIDELTTDDELSGLLNAALDGLDRLRDQGDVSLPESHDERLEMYERFSDHIKAFRVDCLTNEGDSRILKDDIYNAYTNFCAESDREPVGKRTFWQQLRKTTLNVTEKRLAESVDPDRRRAIDNVAWTDLGEEYAPEKLSADPDEADADAELISELAAGDEGVTVECRVTDVENDTPPQIAQKAEVQDESGKPIAVTIWADAGQPPLEEGECYRIKGGAVDTFDGSLYIGVGEMAGVQQISHGVGNAPAADPGPNAQITATDGGGCEDGSDDETDEIEDAVGRLREHLRVEYDAGDTAKVHILAAETDLDPDRVEHAVERIVTEDGTLADAGEDGYEVMK